MTATCLTCRHFRPFPHPDRQFADGVCVLLPKIFGDALVTADDECGSFSSRHFPATTDGIPEILALAERFKRLATEHMIAGDKRSKKGNCTYELGKSRGMEYAYRIATVAVLDLARAKGYPQSHQDG